SGQRDQPAVQLAQQRLVDARLVVEALGVAERHQPAEILVADLVHGEQDEMKVAGRLEIVAAHAALLLVTAITRSDVHLTPDNRLNASRYGGLVEFHGAE